MTIQVNDKKVPADSLQLRVISAVILAPVVLGVVYLGGNALLLLVLVIAAAITWEWNRLTNVAGSTGYLYHLLYISATFSALAFTALGMPLVGIVIILAGAIVVGLAGFISISRSAESAWLDGAGILYIGLPLLSLLWLRLEGGAVAVYWIFLVIWSMDIGAYFVGRNIGGPKMAPRFSPNKTWSGLIGGSLCAGLVGWLIMSPLGMDVMLQNYAVGEGSAGSGIVAGRVNGLVIGLAAVFLGLWSQVGDITESAMKRRAGVKDSSRLIPGHGGVMDRLDGLLFALPIAAIIMLIINLNVVPGGFGG